MNPKNVYARIHPCILSSSSCSVSLALYGEVPRELRDWWGRKPGGTPLLFALVPGHVTTDFCWVRLLRNQRRTQHSLDATAALDFSPFPPLLITLTQGVTRQQFTYGRDCDAFPRLVHFTYRYLDVISSNGHSFVINLGGWVLGVAAPQTSPGVWTLLFQTLY